MNIEICSNIIKGKCYIYTHTNKINNKVFYVGSCRVVGGLRAFDFVNRNNLWKNEVDRISLENLRIDIIHIQENDHDLIKKEYIAQSYYNSIGENYCCAEFRFNGSDNPNYNNRWSDEQKAIMSEKMSGRYNGEDNPNFGKYWTDKQKDNMSDIIQGRHKKGDNPNSKQCVFVENGKFPFLFDCIESMKEYISEKYGHSFRGMYEFEPFLHHYKKHRDLDNSYFFLIDKNGNTKRCNDYPKQLK